MAIDRIGMSHIISQVDESYRADVRILQLAGNNRLENLLELLASKMNARFTSMHASQVNFEHCFSTNRKQTYLYERANGSYS